MNPPTPAQRFANSEFRIARPVMYQRWSDLLFLHWKWDADELQKRLPQGLSIDRHKGDAWLGIVPFFMQRVRPRFLPPVPWLSWFLELNVRTYVFDENGTPGVWFFSLDCNQPLAVRIARTCFRLPYFDARMSAQRHESGAIQYHCQRHQKPSASHFHYRLHQDVSTAAEGSLEFFLVERYVLFANTKRGLRMGRVNHQRYPISPVTVDQFDQHAFDWSGFTPAERPPDHIIGSRGVDVRIGALVKP